MQSTPRSDCPALRNHGSHASVTAKGCGPMSKVQTRFALAAFATGLVTVLTAQAQASLTHPDRPSSHRTDPVAREPTRLALAAAAQMITLSPADGVFVDVPF